MYIYIYKLYHIYNVYIIYIIYFIYDIYIYISISYGTVPSTVWSILFEFLIFCRLLCEINVR